jgi:hypothetical protein
MSCDVELQWKLRKISLVLGNCAAHPHLDSLKNVQIFLSPNITSLVQPMDMGIIKKNPKSLYGAKLINYLLGTIKENLLTSSSTDKQVGARTDLSPAVSFVPIFGEEYVSRRF